MLLPGCLCGFAWDQVLPSLDKNIGKAAKFLSKLDTTLQRINKPKPRLLGSVLGGSEPGQSYLDFALG